MKISIDAKVLRGSLSKINLGHIDKIMPILGYVLVEAEDELTLTLTNLEISITHTVKDVRIEKKGAELISFHFLSELSSTLSGVVEIGEGKLKCGESSYKYGKADLKEYPELPNLEDLVFTEYGSEISESINKAIFASAKDGSIFENRKGIRFEGTDKQIDILAVDGRIMGWEKIDKSFFTGDNFTLPTTAAKKVSNIFPDKVFISKNEDLVTFRDETTQLTSRIYGMSYPNWQSVIPSDNIPLKIAITELRQALKRLVVVSGDSHVKFSIKDNVVSLASLGSEYSGTEVINHENESIDDAEFVVSPKDLLSVTNNFPDEAEFTIGHEGTKPIFITHENFSTLCATMRATQ